MHIHVCRQRKHQMLLLPPSGCWVVGQGQCGLRPVPPMTARMQCPKIKFGQGVRVENLVSKSGVRVEN